MNVGGFGSGAGIGAGAGVGVGAVMEGIKTANTIFQSYLSCINPILTAYPLERVALIV